MGAFLQYLILGLGLGAAYGLVAQGMVVIHRGSGVVNFASSAFGFLGAYVAFELDQAGVPAVGAAAVGILAAAALGWVAHHAVMRRLWAAAQLTRVIATLGMLNLIVGLAVLKIGAGQSIPPYPLPNHGISVLGHTVSTYDFWMLGIAVVVTLGLELLYRRTNFGILTTATAENRRATSALGHSPDTLAGINWAIGSALAAGAGILIAPILSLSVAAISLMLVPALAAAVMGDFISFGITLIGALLVGVVESMVQWANIGQSWPEAVPFLAVIVILLLKGTALPGRSVTQARLPKVGPGTINWRTVVPAIAAVSILTAFVSSGFITAMFLSAAFAIILLSSVVVTGYAGQLSLAQLGLAGIGAFIGARVAQMAGLGFWPALLIAMVGVLPIGLITGIPALRMRGVNLAIVTLGIGVIINEVVLANPSYTGGYTGTQVQPPSLFGLDLNAEFHPARYFLLCLALLVICTVAVSNLRRSSVGRYLIAVRGNERAAASLGLNVARLKLYAFALSAMIAAIGGVLIAYQAPFVNWSTGWDVNSGLTLLTGLVLIGLGYTGGGVQGGLAATGGVIAYLFSLLGTTTVNAIAPALAIGMLVGITKTPDGVLPMIRAKRAARLHRAGTEGPAEDTPADPAQQLALARAQTVRADIQPRHGHKLELDGLSVKFGGVQALDGVSLSVSSGEIVGLIGPNGAGKTTLIDIVTGMTRPTSGSIRLDGREFGRASAATRAQRGLARSFQALELFEDLTVEENIRVSAEENRWWHYLQAPVVPRKKELSLQARAAVEAFGLERDLSRLPSELSYGRRRLVGIVRAIAGGASIVLLDEPAAGLDERESAELAGLLRMLADTWGIGILLVEHDVQLVMNVSDRIVALDFGEVICSGDPAAVRSDPRVRTAYLGEEAHELPADAGSRDPSRTGEPAMAAVQRPASASPLRGNGEILLEARKLTAGYGALAAVRDLDLTVRAGEVVALLGANGAGKTTTILTLAGELVPISGEVCWRSEPWSSGLVSRARSGLALVTEEKSVFMNLTARENLKVGRGDPARASEFFPELDDHLDRRAGLLSGGQQQMLTLGRALASRPALLLADELSLGLAPVIIQRLLSAVRRAADEQGVGVVLVEQHIRSALAIADRVYILQRGRVVFEGDSEKLADRVDEIEAAYLGNSGQDNEAGERGLADLTKDLRM